MLVGIMKGLVEFVASDALVSATDVAIKGIDKLSESAEKKADKKLQKFLDATPGHSHLFATQIRYTFKEKYYIYDQNQAVKYTVKGELLSMKHHLHVYDASGRSELGTVKEKLISLRSPLSLDSNPKDFDIEVEGKKIGKVKTKAAFTKQKFDVTFNGWRVEGDVFGKNYKILDSDDNVIMLASQKLSYLNDMYFVDITNPQDEFYCVMILLALDSASITKGEETKRAIKKKRIL